MSGGSVSGKETIEQVPATGQTKAIIEVKNLVNKFGKQTVHDGLSFDVHTNEILGIVGGSGSGKSVLMRTMIGLRKPSSGEIIVDGKDIATLNAKEMFAIQRLWGVLFQSGALFSSMSVADNVALPIREFGGITDDQARELAEIKIELVGLPSNARDKYPSELSGGMIKRAGLARALALDPRILFLDEPTSGLDPISAAEFDALIKELTRDLKLAVVMITHDMDSLFTLCDRIAVLVDKKIHMGTLDEQLASDHPWIKKYFHGERARGAQLEHAKA